MGPHLTQSQSAPMSGSRVGDFFQAAVSRWSAILLLLVIWYVVAAGTGKAIILPDPLRVLGALAALAQEELLSNVAVSLKRVLLGWGIASAVAVPLGLLLGLSLRARSLLVPTLEVLRPIPAIAWIPVFLLVFGVGPALPISIVFYAAFFPILLNTMLGVRGVQTLHQQVALTLGAGQWYILLEVVLPAVLPAVLTGLRLGMTFGWMSVVAAELVGATEGVGARIIWYQQTFASDRVIGYMAVIGALGLALDRSMALLGRVAAPWRSGVALHG